MHRSIVYAETIGPSDEERSIEERADPASLGGARGAGVTLARGGGVGAGVLRDDPKRDAKGFRRLAAEGAGTVGARCAAAAVPGRAGSGGGCAGRGSRGRVRLCPKT